MYIGLVHPLCGYTLTAISPFPRPFFTRRSITLVNNVESKDPFIPIGSFVDSENTSFLCFKRSIMSGAT